MNILMLEERCPGGGSPDGTHCSHWWDGEACHWCNAPEMQMEKKVLLGMAEGPPRNPNVKPSPSEGPGMILDLCVLAYLQVDGFETYDFHSHEPRWLWQTVDNINWSE